VSAGTKRERPAQRRNARSNTQVEHAQAIKRPLRQPIETAGRGNVRQRADLRPMLRGSSRYITNQPSQHPVTLSVSVLRTHSRSLGTCKPPPTLVSCEFLSRS
jgi:hypothetical protein